MFKYIQLYLTGVLCSFYSLLMCYGCNLKKNTYGEIMKSPILYCLYYMGQYLFIIIIKEYSITNSKTLFILFLITSVKNYS